ncbi:MAG: phage tail tape measure protein, partial [Burkholderiales bacterium]|nr:phage tail tape measure protein [Burkholderiales bacterium]
DAYKLTLDGAEQTADAINHLSNQMRVESADLFRILAKAGPAAREFGLSANQVAALGAAFVHMKAEPTKAAASIDGLLKKLGTAGQQGKEFEDGLFRIGMSAEVMAKMVKENPQQALMKFLELVKESPEGMPLLDSLFGAGQSDDIARLIQGLDHYKSALAEVSDEQKLTGSLQEEYETMAKATSNSLLLLKNQIVKVGVVIGSALLPGLNALVSVIRPPIELVGKLAERFPVLTQVVVGATAAAIGLKLATFAMGYAWTFVKGPFLMANVWIHKVRAGLALAKFEALANAGAANILATAWTRMQTGAMGLLAPIKSAALAFWAMLPAIGATTAALLANPITWIVVGIGAAVAGLALVIRKYWDPIAAYVGGVFDGIRSAMQPAIESLSTALAPLAPIGNAVAATFGWIGDAIGGLVGWVSQLLAPVTLTQDEFDSMSVSGQSLGTVIGSVLGGAFTALTFPLRVVGTLVGWVIGALQSLASFSPLAAISAGWQPVADFFTNLWSGITAEIGQAIDWIIGKVGWVMDTGKQVGDWFGALFGDDKPAASPTTADRPVTVGSTVGAPARPVTVGSTVSAAMPGATSAAGATAHPLAQTAQPVAGRGTTSTSITAPITVNAPPGMDAREIASLIEARLRALMRETTRSPAAAMYD